jgi:diamine N-acetyltransferase
MIQLVKVTNQNLKACLEIYDTLDDIQKTHVAPNAISLAQAYINQDIAWPRVIVEDNQVIGFIMLELHAEDIPDYNKPGHYIWRFMIGKTFQNKGYGKHVLSLVIDKCKKENMSSLYVSCTMKQDMPYRFYIQNGFIDTGYDENGERYLKMLF